MVVQLIWAIYTQKSHIAIQDKFLQSGVTLTEFNR